MQSGCLNQLQSPSSLEFLRLTVRFQNGKTVGSVRDSVVVDAGGVSPSSQVRLLCLNEHDIQQPLS